MKNSLMPIRSCRREDVPQVAQLYLKTFPGSWQSSADDLAHYIAQVYIDNPWAHDDFPSLVFQRSGAIEGFVGIVPRQMNYQGDGIRVVVPSAFMVSQDAAGRRNPIVAISLLRRLFDGEQDLTITDTANERSRSLWTKCGGNIAFPYNFNWLRPLRPFGAGAEMAAGVVPRFVQLLANPIARLGDAITASLRINPLLVRKPDLLVEDMDTATQLEEMESLPEYSLIPNYDLSSLQWLIDMAQQCETDGILARRIVRGRDGGVKGWFIYYQNRRSVGRVLQLVATHPPSMDDMLNCLLYEAQAAGLAALWGRTDPIFPALSTQRLCVFFAKPMVLMHSKRANIVRSVLEGEMFFSGVEGELWMAVNSWN